MSSVGSANSDPSPLRPVRVLVVVSFFAAVMRTPAIFWFHPLNWDEIEFFRATDWIARGLVPYRDFWEHHTPLMWFLFAPLAALTSSPGVTAITVMRWGQVPLWIAAFWLVMHWMRGAGIPSFGRWAAVAATLCSSFFMIPAVEYRVDTLACLLYLAGLYLLQRMPEDRRAAFWSGVLFTLVGMANLRMGPLLAVTVLLARIVDSRERRWKSVRRANWVFAGAIAALAACLIYFIATHSLADLYRRVWHDNYLGDTYGQPMTAAFFHRLLIPLGIRIFGAAQSFELVGVDIGGVILLAFGFVGLVRSLLGWRRPDDIFLLACFQITSLLFIAKMNFIYNYHFEIVALMMVPFAAIEIDRLTGTAAARKNAMAGVLIIASIAAAALVLFRGKEADRQYQDFVMHEVHRRTRGGDRVFDGAGWALRRKPAYEYWFLPDMVRQLEARGLIAPYRAPQAIAEPPAAVVADYNVLLWMRLHPDLRWFLARHYLPVWRSLWVPGLSAPLTSEVRAASWIAPVDGRYRIFASPRLLRHGWFRDPLLHGTFYDDSPPNLRLDLNQYAVAGSEDLRWLVDGKEVRPADGALTLRRRQRVDVTYGGAESTALMLVPGSDRYLFQQPGFHVTIEAAYGRETHVPDIPQLIRSLFR